MTSERFTYLFNSYIQQTATTAEEIELMEGLRDPELEITKGELIEKAYDELPVNYTLSDERADLIFQQIVKRKAPVRKLFWRRIAVAASVLLMIAIGSYFLIPGKTKKANQPVAVITHDAQPGTYKAKLTLSDGRTIVLDSAAIGELTKQGGTVVMNKDGQLVYTDNGNTNEVLYNTLSTAKGETYSTTLSDGTKVWLNSASTIKFPVAFNGTDRKVEITGEAYFDVVHDSRKPFTVLVNGTEVYDIGTEFNINAYNDEEALKVTLISGLAKVNSVLITPGQQAVVYGATVINKNANVAEAIAWKTGFFSFNNADVQTVMRQLSRWYDVTVSYEGTVTKDKFTGDIDRNIKLSKVLDNLAKARIHFRIEGKQLTITP